MIDNKYLKHLIESPLVYYVYQRDLSIYEVNSKESNINFLVIIDEAYEVPKEFKQYKDKEYSYVNAYIIDDAIFFIEPNFYTQLVYFKEYYKDKYNDLINAILDTAKTNKHVIFTGDFESPVVHKEDYIYREIDDCLAKIKLTFDNKSNPESDWKD